MDFPITFTGRGVEITDAMKSFVEDRISKLLHIELATHVSCEIGQTTSHRGAAKDFYVRFLINLPKAQVRLRKDGPEVYALIDEMVLSLKKKMVQYKENFKKWEGAETWPEADLVEDASLQSDDVSASYAGYTPKIRRKVIREMTPMSVTEAIERMELLDKDYFIFKDVQSSSIAIVARKGGEYEVVVAA